MKESKLIILALILLIASTVNSLKMEGLIDLFLDTNHYQNQTLYGVWHPL